MSQVANIKSKVMRNGIAIGYSNSYEAVANSTDVGGSGGLGPGTITACQQYGGLLTYVRFGPGGQRQRA